jgi:hypothetical protein
MREPDVEEPDVRFVPEAAPETAAPAPSHDPDDPRFR